MFAHYQTISAAEPPISNQSAQSSAVVADSKELQPISEPSTSVIAPPTIELSQSNVNTKTGFTQVQTAAELKTALENGNSVQLAADITLNHDAARIQLGKSNPQNITIDGTDPITGQHHHLDIIDSLVATGTTYLNFGANMAGKTIEFTNLKLTNNNYYGLCHPVLDSYSKGSTLLLNNVEYTSNAAQALHLIYGVIAFSGNNTITQTNGIYSQEFAETGRLDFNGGTTTINHTGSGTYGLLRVDQVPTDGVAPGIQVADGAKVAITTNNAIFPTVGLGIPHIDIESKGTGSDLTMNAGAQIFNVTGNSGSKTVATNGASISVTKGTNFYQTGNTNQTINATNNSHINLQLSGVLYNLAQTQAPMHAAQNSTIDIKTTGPLSNSSQTKSPITADQESTINLTSDSNLFNGYVQDTPVSATNKSQISLKAGKDLFTNIYNPTTGNPAMQVTTDSTSKMNLAAQDAFIRNAQTNSDFKLAVGGELVATFGQYYANASARKFFFDFQDNSVINLTINGPQSIANGLIPLGMAGSYMQIGDHSQVTVNNQTTTAQPLLLGASTGNSLVAIGDADVTFNNNTVAETPIFDHINLHLENPGDTNARPRYRGITLTEKNQSKTVFPFVHFTASIGTSTTVSSTDDTFRTKLVNLKDTKGLTQFHLHDPLPPEILTLENTSGLPADDVHQFNFDLHGTATPGSELNVNFLTAVDQSLLAGPKKAAASNQTYQYQWLATMPTEQHKIVLEANYPAPYTLTNPTRKILKDIPPPQLAFLKAPTHFEFTAVSLSNSKSPIYSYDATSDADLIISDPRNGNRGDWSVQVNLTKQLTATPANLPTSTLEDALIWTKDAQSTPLKLNIPQHLFSKAGYTSSDSTPDVADLSSLLKSTLQAQFPAGPKIANEPYTAELEFILVSAPY
ncbi:hypothetical protein LG542_06470 [Latilactobacillus graminis]|uniref:WxL domain-containing protein n=1 Tax=Latilactobacillus graminis TaxID=60519 RepID=A0ABX6C8H2_9LACO|nr:hypothetical protein [Latilactobacillus graminis]QFP79913.1 hypothetical protein LG542_06470 [Latilactobacillus graminis]